MTIDITHDALMVPVPLLNGRHATVVNSVTGQGRTCVTTVGTESFLLDDLLTIDTIRVTVVNGGSLTMDSVTSGDWGYNSTRQLMIANGNYTITCAGNTNGIAFSNIVPMMVL